MRLNSRFLSFGLTATWGVLLASSALGQFATQGVTLKTQILPSALSSTGGNDCWGYVSPSGREYAIMGLLTQVAFIEVTNPTAPVIVGVFPHTSSTWGDIKVFGSTAYAVTESATGIQVFDMSNIDSGQVTLVRTIMSPARTHNIQVDTVSGYLYTCGSRDGTGTTMCFSLADPLNPVQVGAPSMTISYQHDGVPVTYNSGPHAGKQLWFGFSESRGVDIYDFTNKNVPVKIATATYPNMRYCHQGWISADRKFLYVDDELDEPNFTSVTRSLVFNVEDPYNPSYIGTFTSGLPSIDHNQYWTDGFIFQANYTSGLRIFDAENPLLPVQVGFFDTYPNNNNANFNGAWSNYPFFPSGNVVVSDINRGFFLVDPTTAVTRTRIPASYFLPAGRTTGGSASSFSDSDNNYLDLANNPALDLEGPPISMIVSGKAFDDSPLKLKVLVESNGVSTWYKQSIELKNWLTGDFETVGSGNVRVTDSIITVEATGNLSRFVNPANKDIEARISWYPTGQDVFNARVRVDEINILVTR